MKEWLTDSRLTGLLYLGLAISGLIGYLMAGSQIYVEGDATATLNNIVDDPTLARTSLIGDLGVVFFQVLAALWFFKTFRKVSPFAAGMLAAFGFMNAVVIMIGLIFSTTAVQVALEGGNAETVQLLWSMHEVAWGVGNLFFGLWLIPMGYLVLRANMPKLLGWVLYAGGVGYVLSAKIYLLAPDATALIDGLPIFATIGEFWIIGYLLFKPIHFEDEPQNS